MTAAAFVALGPLFPAAQTSPPSAPDGTPPAVGTGMATTSKPVMPALANCGSCHGPLTIIASDPFANCSSTLACVQDRTSLAAEPAVTRSDTSCSAKTACGE